jgi:hypothetical protein
MFAAARHSNRDARPGSKKKARAVMLDTARSRGRWYHHPRDGTLVFLNVGEWDHGGG